MSRSNRRRSIIGALLALLLITAGAVAYWTAGGSGSGSASAGTSAPLTVNQTGTLTAMYPGDSAQTLSGTFGNTNSGPIHVGTVTASIASVTQAVGAVGTCDASDFTLANAAMTVNADVPAGTGVGSWTGATIKFNNKAGTNQDGCKLATVNLSYAIS